jgi:hypothetical protein
MRFDRPSPTPIAVTAMSYPKHDRRQVLEMNLARSNTLESRSLF